MIRRFPDDALLKECSRVETFDKGLALKAEYLTNVLKSNNLGIGLAANQAGLEDSIIIVLHNGKYHTLVNPEILWRSKDTVVCQEGCLSFPGLYLEIPRHAEIKATYQTITGETKDVSASGLLAILLQHEIDHLGGMTFLSRTSPPSVGQNIARLIEQRQRRNLQRDSSRRNTK